MYIVQAKEALACSALPDLRNLVKISWALHSCCSNMPTYHRVEHCFKGTVFFRMMIHIKIRHSPCVTQAQHGSAWKILPQYIAPFPSCCCCASPAALLLSSVVQVEEVCDRSRVSKFPRREQMLTQLSNIKHILISLYISIMKVLICVFWDVYCEILAAGRFCHNGC